MYFLSEDERKQLARFHLPRAREAGVADELRGWNWDQPPLQPIYDIRLGVFDVANHYCPRDRDLYFRRVEHQAGTPTLLMLKGRLYHSLMARMVTLAKKHIYAEGIERIKFLPEEVRLGITNWFEEMRNANTQIAELITNQDSRLELEALMDFEIERIWARVQEVLTRQPYIQEDALVASAIPVTVEQKLNGSFLGLSAMLSSDALTYAEPIVVDLKFGPKEDFYRLATTGYALVLEALYDFPVEIGCVVYAQYKKGRWLIERDLHIIGDELRQRFIEERDEKMRLVYEELDPGPEHDCKIDCAYFTACEG